MKAPLAIVTMVYNEPEFLPLWCRHYGFQVGETACYVVDHGTTDGSTANLGKINLIRIPRSPQDDEKRAHAVSLLCESLLDWYEAVIYVDVDEFLVADPDLHPSLSAFACAWDKPLATATGLDVVHQLDTERPIDWSVPVSHQRRRIRFSSAMCKAVMIREPVRWVPGFHNTEAVPDLSAPLFLFHLRYVDLNNGLARLNRTRNQPWVDIGAGRHQRMLNEEWANMLRGMASLPERSDVTLAPDDKTLAAWRAQVTFSSFGRTQERYKLDLHISGDALWHLPERFIGTF